MDIIRSIIYILVVNSIIVIVIVYMCMYVCLCACGKETALRVSYLKSMTLRVFVMLTLDLFSDHTLLDDDQESKRLFWLHMVHLP